ncbi:hypothetical protein G5B39_00395 [Rhodobacteraceae bacterium SC52]|nr:hypothetical protein G5B39_00395 [Rhodobacteraceae bacterium SC52]
MTVLSKYERLECAGIWHPAPDAQRQDVFVSLGKATLVIKDANDTALAHWSLPAVHRINPGERPALYTPGADADELLELDDESMIEAVRIVGRALGKARAHPGRLRRGIFMVSAVALVGLSVWWLPGAVTRHTADLMPGGLRGEIGQRLLRELIPYAGQPCTSRSGTQALTMLHNRLLSEPGWSVVIVPGGPAVSAHLPGRIIMLRKDVIEEQNTPQLAAGLILAEAALATDQDPILALIQSAGLPATFQLLTQGAVSDETLQAYAAKILTEPPAPLPPEALSAQFAELGIPMAPYAAATGQTIGQTVTEKSDPSARPLLSDATWLKLRSICEN